MNVLLLKQLKFLVNGNKTAAQLKLSEKVLDVFVQYKIVSTLPKAKATLKTKYELTETGKQLLANPTELANEWASIEKQWKKSYLR